MGMMASAPAISAMRRCDADLRRQRGRHAEDAAADDHVDDRRGQREGADGADQCGFALRRRRARVAANAGPSCPPRLTAERRTAWREPSAGPPRRMRAMTSHELPLGRPVDYPRHYDPGLLFPIARAVGRTALSLAGRRRAALRRARPLACLRTVVARRAGQAGRADRDVHRARGFAEPRRIQVAEALPEFLQRHALRSDADVRARIAADLRRPRARRSTCASACRRWSGTKTT